MHTHTHTHVYKRIDVQIHTHMHIYAYIHVRTHTQIHTYTHTHTKYTYTRTQACLERQRGSKRARSRCRRRKLCMSLPFDASKPHFAPPMQELHCTHFLKHQYPSTPHPLFPTYPRTVCGPRVSAVLLFYTDQMNRVHNSEEAPRRFTKAPCVVLERLEGKQWCSRAAVGEHAGIQAREWSRWLFTKKRKANGKTTKLCNSPSHNQNSAAPKQHPAHLHWCRADPPSSWPAQAAIHWVYAIGIHIFAIFPPLKGLCPHLFLRCLHINRDWQDRLSLQSVAEEA